MADPTAAVHPDRPGVPRALVVLTAAAAAVVVVAGIRTAAGLVAPIFLALVIVIAISPVKQRFGRLGLPGWLSTLLLVLLVQGVIVSFAVVIVLSVARLATILPRYQGQIDALVHSAAQGLAGLGIGPEQIREIVGGVDPQGFVRIAGGLLSGVVGLAGSLLFVLTLLLFLGLESAGTNARIERIAQDRPAGAEALRRFAWGTRRYLLVATAIGAAVATVNTTVLLLLGIPLALLWGVLSFLTNYIPYVGFFIGVIPPTLLALLEGGWQLAVAVYVIYSVVNLVLSTLLQPRLIGNAVDLSVAVTFVALVFWASVLGAVGALLAIPLTLLTKALLVDVDPRAGWADALLRGSKTV